MEGRAGGYGGVWLTYPIGSAACDSDIDPGGQALVLMAGQGRCCAAPGASRWPERYGAAHDRAEWHLL
eukprot:365135-Chlamydomonas_euryale.AAC.2